MAVKSMLLVFLHDLISPCEEDSGAEKGQMDKDLPLDVLGVFILDVDERFEKMNAGDTDQRRCEFDLDGAGVDVGQPVWSICMTLQI